MYSFGIKMLRFGVDGCLFHQFTVGCPVAAVDQIEKLRCSEATFKSVEGLQVVRFRASKVLVVEPGRIFFEGLIVSLP